MPAFGKNGIVNLNNPSVKETWEVKDSNGESRGVFQSESQANLQKEILSKNGVESSVNKKELHCL